MASKRRGRKGTHPPRCVVKKANGTVVWLTDTPERILERLTFYDKDSRLIDKTLNDQEKLLYLKEIKKDINYFRRSHRRAQIAGTLHGDVSAVRSHPPTIRPISSTDLAAKP